MQEPPTHADSKTAEEAKSVKLASLPAKPDAGASLHKRSPVVSYGVALVSVALATLVRMALTPVVGTTALPFLTFFLAIAFSAWFGGFGPAILSVVLSASIAAYAFIPELFSYSITRQIDLWYLSFFVLVGVCIAAIGGAQHKAQQALRTSEKMLETTLRSIGDGVIATDVLGRVTLLNGMAQRLTGWSEADAKGREAREIFHIVNESTRTEVENPIHRVLGEKIAVGLANHTVLISKSGQEYPIDDSGAPIHDASGQIYGAVLVFRDVSERKQRELTQQFLTQVTEALASSLDYEQTLQKVAQLAVPHIADWCAVDMIDEEGRIVLLAVAHVDPEKVKWGYQLRNQYPSELTDPTGVPRVLRTGQTELYSEITDEMLVAGARDEQHLEVMRQIGFRSGMVVPIVVRERTLGAITFVTSSESGRLYGDNDKELAEGLAARAALAIDNSRLIMAARTELVKRRKAQEAARTSEERFRFALANSNIAVYNQDADLRYTWVYSGARRDELTHLYGRTDEEFLEAEDAANLTEIKRRVLRTGVEERHIVRATQKGKEQAYFDTIFAPLRDSHGEAVGVTGTVADVTERKKNQDALARHQQEIEGLNIRLQRSMRETHHRVKNNLQVITALINIQQVQYEDQVPAAELTRLTQHIRALASIHDLLTKQAQTDAEVSDICVREIMDKLMPTLQSMSAGREIIWDIKDMRLPIRHGTTYAVLVNELVSNAMKHGAGEIKVVLRESDGVGRLCVMDEGPGFPPDFDPVTAAHTALTKTFHLLNV